jgi:hypothetical protein
MENKETKPNEPINTIEYNNNYISTGLTKREYFALKTMHALTIAEGGASFITVIDAVKLADALIDELNKTK